MQQHTPTNVVKNKFGAINNISCPGLEEQTRGFSCHQVSVTGTIPITNPQSCNIHSTLQSILLLFSTQSLSPGIATVAEFSAIYLPFYCTLVHATIRQRKEGEKTREGLHHVRNRTRSPLTRARKGQILSLGCSSHLRPMQVRRGRLSTLIGIRCVTVYLFAYRRRLPYLVSLQAARTRFRSVRGSLLPMHFIQTCQYFNRLPVNHPSSNKSLRNIATYLSFTAARPFLRTNPSKGPIDIDPGTTPSLFPRPRSTNDIIS